MKSLNSVLRRKLSTPHYLPKIFLIGSKGGCCRNLQPNPTPHLPMQLHQCSCIHSSVNPEPQVISFHSEFSSREGSRNETPWIKRVHLYSSRETAETSCHFQIMIFLELCLQYWIEVLHHICGSQQVESE